VAFSFLEIAQYVVLGWAKSVENGPLGFVGCAGPFPHGRRFAGSVPVTSVQSDCHAGLIRPVVLAD
jgi:hypothetical protein